MKRFHMFVQSPKATMSHLLGSFESIEAAEDALAQREDLLPDETHARLFRANDDGALEIWRIYYHNPFWGEDWRAKYYEPERRGENYRIAGVATA